MLRGNACAAAEPSVGRVRFAGVKVTVADKKQASIGHRAKVKYVRADLSRADCGGVRRDRLDAEVGIVSIANTVGLVLSVLIALLLGAALMFPERF
jgi:hypothetical protein